MYMKNKQQGAVARPLHPMSPAALDAARQAERELQRILQAARNFKPSKQPKPQTSISYAPTQTPRKTAQPVNNRSANGKLHHNRFNPDNVNGVNKGGNAPHPARMPRTAFVPPVTQPLPATKPPKKTKRGRFSWLPWTKTPNPASQLPQGRQTVYTSVNQQSFEAMVLRKFKEHTAAILAVGLGLGVLVVFAVINSFVSEAKVGKLESTVTADHAITAQLNAGQKQLRADTAAAVEQMRQMVAEVKYPPSEYLDAVNAFKEQRYVVAESGFRSFVLKYPNSHVADKALLNAAVASAMHNSCDMAESYRAQLKQRFPSSPLVQDADSVARQCRVLLKK